MRGVSRLVGSGSRTPNGSRPGRSRCGCRLGGGCRGGEASPAGGWRRSGAGPRASRTARPGHAVRIEADRCDAARPTDIPAEARAPSVRPSTVRCGVHTSTGAGRVERLRCGRGSRRRGSPGRRGDRQAGAGERVLDRRERAAARAGMGRRGKSERVRLTLSINYDNVHCRN